MDRFTVAFFLFSFSLYSYSACLPDSSGYNGQYTSSYGVIYSGGSACVSDTRSRIASQWAWTSPVESCGESVGSGGSIDINYRLTSGPYKDSDCAHGRTASCNRTVTCGSGQCFDTAVNTCVSSDCPVNTIRDGQTGQCLTVCDPPQWRGSDNQCHDCPDGEIFDLDTHLCRAQTRCEASAGTWSQAQSCSTSGYVCIGGCTANIVHHDDIALKLKGDLCAAYTVQVNFDGTSCAPDSPNPPKRDPIKPETEAGDYRCLDGKCLKKSCDPAAAKSVCGRTESGGTYCINWAPCDTNTYSAPPPVDPVKPVMFWQDPSPEPDQQMQGADYASSYWSFSTATARDDTDGDQVPDEDDSDIDGDGILNGDDPDRDGSGAKDESEKSDFCVQHPDALACQKIGDPASSEEIPTREVTSSWSSEMSAAGSCPADLTASYLGRPVSISFGPICTFARGVRPALLLVAALGAMLYVFLMIRRSA